MGIGAITVPTAGVVTEPTDVLHLSYPTADSMKVTRGLPLCSVLVPYSRGVMAMFANGVDPLRHWAGGSFLRTGLLAPSTAPVATPTGAQASATLDLDVSSDGAYTIANNDIMRIRNSTYAITFVTALTANDGFEVLVGANNAETLANLTALINHEAGFGTTYQFKVSGSLVESTVDAAFGALEAEILTATTWIVRAKSFGSFYNSYLATLPSGVWTDCSFGSSGSFSGGSDGSGSSPAAGSYVYGYAFYRDTDLAFSGLSPTTTADNGAAQNIGLDGLTQSTDASATHVVWFRSTKDGTEAELWRGEYVSENAGTNDEDTDDIADEDLTGYGATLYDERVYRSYRAGYPPVCRWLAYHLGSVFAGGAEISAPYSQGTASVTAASASVTLSSGAYPTTKMIGRAFRVTDDDSVKTYRILNVVAATRVLTLDTEYEGSTDGTAAYSIVDDRDPYELFWSEPGLPNAWPVTQSRKGAGGQDVEGITAVVPMWGSLHVFTRDGVFRLSGSSPSSLVMQQVVFGVGCISQHTVVGVDGWLYWMAEDGIYLWTGDGSPIRISNPETQNPQPIGIHGTIRRINTAHWRWFQAHYDQDDKVIRWLVPLDDAVTPSHAIVYDVQAKAWSLDNLEGITRLADVDVGSDVAWTVGGDDFGKLWQMDTGTSDGGFGVEPVVAASSVTRTTLTASGTPFGTAGDYDGVPVVLVGTTTGVFVRNRIASHTSSVLTFATPFDTTLSSAWKVVLGGVLLEVESGHFDLGIGDEEWTLHKADIEFEPADDGQVYFAVGVDRGSLASPEFGDESVDLTEADGHGRLEGGLTGKAHRIAFYAVEPGCDVILRRFELLISARGRMKVGA